MSWSESLKIKTEEILTYLPFSAFIRDNKCFLKHQSGKYGTLSIENALSGHYQIELLNSDNASETYTSVDELLNAGWVVD